MSFWIGIVGFALLICVAVALLVISVMHRERKNALIVLGYLCALCVALSLWLRVSPR